MGLTVHQERITPELGEKLRKLCPFGAISYGDGALSIVKTTRTVLETLCASCLLGKCWGLHLCALLFTLLKLDKRPRQTQSKL